MPGDYSIFLDESGDLGWRFDKPLGQGGSSRHLTIAAIVVPTNARHHPKRIIRELHDQFGWDPKIEVKASEATPAQCRHFASELASLKTKIPGISIRAITVRKEHVRASIRKDENLIYNYMIRQHFAGFIASCDRVILCPDRRSIKVESGNSLKDYLLNIIRFDYKSDVEFIYTPVDSAATLNARVADFIAHIVYTNFEQGLDEGYTELTAAGLNHYLLFPKPQAP